MGDVWRNKGGSIPVGINPNLKSLPMVFRPPVLAVFTLICEPWGNVWSQTEINYNLAVNGCSLKEVSLHKFFKYSKTVETVKHIISFQDRKNDFDYEKHACLMYIFILETFLYVD